MQYHKSRAQAFLYIYFVRLQMCYIEDQMQLTQNKTVLVVSYFKQKK